MFPGQPQSLSGAVVSSNKNLVGGEEKLAPSSRSGASTFWWCGPTDGVDLSPARV